MIISLLLPRLTAVAEAMSSDPLRVCALLPSPRSSVSFTCTNLSVCTQRRRFLAVKNHRSLTLNIRRNRGRTSRASSTAESSGVRRGRSAAHAARPAPVQGTLATSVYKPSPSVPPVFAINGFWTRSRAAAHSTAAYICNDNGFKIKSKAAHSLRAYGPPSKGGKWEEYVGCWEGGLDGDGEFSGILSTKGCAGYIAS